jgi:hypothetical protein
VRLRTLIALIVGLTAVAAVVAYAGTGAVTHALERLRVSALLTLVLLHLPLVAMMGVAWWLVCGEDPPASRARFIWGRLVRDAAQEALPVLPFGGVLFGLRALGGKRASTIGAISASIDGVIELAAKLPYVLAALLTLLAFSEQRHLALCLATALAATAVLVLLPVLARRRLGSCLPSIVRALTARWPALRSLGGEALPEIEACIESLLCNRAPLWWGFALHLCCWCLGAAEIWVTFRLLRVDLRPCQALAIDGVVVGLRTFAFMLPAAAGVQEASYLLAAVAFGVTPAAAIAASFARRARDLLLASVVLPFAAIGPLARGRGSVTTHAPMEVK